MKTGREKRKRKKTELHYPANVEVEIILLLGETKKLRFYSYTLKDKIGEVGPAVVSYMYESEKQSKLIESAYSSASPALSPSQTWIPAYRCSSVLGSVITIEVRQVDSSHS